jgi:acyl carrier protein
LEGELYIGGDGLAHGYINRPELTAARFVPDPFGRKPGGRLYKTGDRARHLGDGAIEFIGRTDFQVKIRGFRIELNEIVSLLEEHPAVQDAIVIARKDDGDGRLIAYLLPKPGEKPDSEKLRNWLKNKLPIYMIPSLFIFVEQWPLTPNGKVDRSALPAPETAQAATQPSYVAPGTVIEEAVASLWAQVLKVERVGLYDNFFELGGHSLLATQLISRLRDAFQIDVGLRDLFEHATVSELIPILIARETTPGKTEKVAQVIKRLAGMSPAEIKKILEAERLRKGKG